MTFSLLWVVPDAVFKGITSYALCRGFSQPNAFEKAILTTVLVGSRNLAEEAIAYKTGDERFRQPLSKILMASVYLLSVPFALYAGRVFSFKEADFLQIAGLAALGLNIRIVLMNLIEMFPRRPT
jgi:hypothetical protein